jgi:hypothetical protein
LDERHFAQGFQDLGRLAGIKLLLAFGFSEIVEQPIGAHRHGEVAEPVIAE